VAAAGVADGEEEVGRDETDRDMDGETKTLSAK